MKYISSIPWILLCIAIAAIAIMANRTPEVITEHSVRVDTLTVIDTLRVPVYRNKVITKIDTVYIDEHLYTVGRYTERIDTTNVIIDLDISYWEQLRKFDVKADVTTSIPTTYITETITNVIQKPYPMFAFIAGISPMFSQEKGRFGLNSVSADAGVRLNGKYDIGLVANTNAAYGLGFRVKF